jgi:N-acetyltransferase
MKFKEDKEGMPQKRQKTGPTLYDQLMEARAGGPQTAAAAAMVAVAQKKKPTARKTKDGKVQTFLDCGQKDFVSTTCSVCGLTFARGTEDEKVHAKFHRKETAPVHFAGWATKATVAQRLPSATIVACPVAGEELDAVDKGLRRAVEEVCEMINRALGFPSGSKEDSRTTTTTTISSPSLSERKSERLFVYVDPSARALGGVIVERIKWAHRIVAGSGSGAEEGAVFCRNQEEPADAGVSRIWVHPSARRFGVATKLLDAVRSEFIYAYAIPLERLAFSQPTPDGLYFFRHYTGRDDFLVYS